MRSEPFRPIGIALVDENASNAVFNACDSIVDRLSVFDKKSELSMLRRLINHQVP